jgi:hypothetical protein
MVARSHASGRGLADPRRPGHGYGVAIATREGTGILERDEVLAALERARVAACDGNGALVFLGGEAGVGKTSVARRFCTPLDEAATMVADLARGTPRRRPTDDGIFHDASPGSW